MLKNHLKIACRNLAKRKFYSALNIFGLSLGVACSIFLYLFISFHLSFDTYHKKAATTYRLVNDILFDQTLHDKGASIGMYGALSDLSQVDEAAVMISKQTFTVAIVNLSGEVQRFNENRNVSIVSPEWFKLFDYHWLAGNADELEEPNTVALTQKQADKYFGKTDPLGKTILFENKQLVKVVGLISDKPGNTDLKADMYISLSSLKNLKPETPERFFTDWRYINSSTSVYLSLSDTNKKNEVESTLRNLTRVHLPDNWKFYSFKLQPLSDVHFDSAYGASIQKSLLVTLAIIGLLILSIACINYINITIAQQAKRSVEIGTRKVLGGTTGQLFTQFLSETFITTVLAILLAIGMVALLRPLANQYFFTEEPLSLVSYTSVAIFLMLLLIFLLLSAGLYPAFILSGINVFKALKNEAAGWKAGFLTKVLVIFQNSAAQILILCTLIMVLQVRFLKQTDTGFNRDAVVNIPISDTSQLNRNFLAKKLEAIPLVQSFSFCYKPPSAENFRGGSLRFENRDWEKWVSRSAVGDTSYLKTFGLKLIAGRNFTSANEFVINETMVSKLGLNTPEQAIGKFLIAGEFDNEKRPIVGVVKDFNTVSLLSPIEPTVIVSYPKNFSSISIKLTGGNLQGGIETIQKSFNEVYPDEIFDYQFLDDQIASLYKKEALQEKIIWITTLIAISISCLGLLGLISLITLQRTKEIGIRKVLGASVTSIVALLSSDFLKLILISIFLASPLAWWAMSKWLQSFAYRIEIEWWMFALAGSVAILIAVITISFQAVKTALANPIKSLRTE